MSYLSPFKVEKSLVSVWEQGWVHEAKATDAAKDKTRAGEIFFSPYNTDACRVSDGNSVAGPLRV